MLIALNGMLLHITLMLALDIHPCDFDLSYENSIIYENLLSINYYLY